MKKIVILSLSLSLCLFIITSCDPNRIYEEYIEIPDGIWNRYNMVKFSVNVSDTLTPHNVYVNIRNTGLYTKSNLFLFITITSPDGTSIRDTFECILADEKGRWLGKGLGDIVDNQILYKKNVLFPNPGTYTFEYEQAMRIENLPFIMDVGLRVEKLAVGSRQMSTGNQ